MVLRPRPRMGFGKKLLIGAVTILTLGGASAWFGRDTLSREIDAFWYRNDPSVVAALPGPQRDVVREAVKSQKKAIAIRDVLVKDIEAKYQPGTPGSRQRRFGSSPAKRKIIAHIDNALANLLRVDNAFLKGNRAEAAALVAAAQTSLNEAEAGVKAVESLREDESVAWAGEDKAEALARIGKLRKIAAAMLAALGLS